MSLGELRESAIIAMVIDHVSKAGRFCGETFIQKSTFFLKELFGIEFSATFRPYHYGPYSFDLREQLRSMEADDIVRVKPHPWGATYVTGERFAMLKKQFPVTRRKYEGQIDFVVRELSPLGVKELEPLATALFITRERPKATVESRAQELNRLKAHIEMPAARTSVARIDEWMLEYPPRPR